MINIGSFILNLFNGIIEFFATLYNLINYNILLPDWLKTILNSVFTALGQSWTAPNEISVLGLISIIGAPIAFSLAIYYILKGAL